MTEPDDPPRLLDTASAPEGLKTALRAAQADLGSDEQVARLARRLGPLLGAGAVGAGVGAASNAGSAAKLGGAVKLGIAALGLLAGGGALLLSSREPAAPAVIAKSAAAPAALVPLVAPAPSEPPSLPDSASGPELALPSALPPLEPEAKSRERAAPVTVNQLSEAELLEQARAALKSDPARALQRANEHAARFPHGVLVQEREVLAIQALRRLGRTADAERRAQAFAQAFPGSAFQRKLKPDL